MFGSGLEMITQYLQTSWVVQLWTLPLLNYGIQSILPHNRVHQRLRSLIHGAISLNFFQEHNILNLRLCELSPVNRFHGLSYFSGRDLADSKQSRDGWPGDTCVGEFVDRSRRLLDYVNSNAYFDNASIHEFDLFLVADVQLGPTKIHFFAILALHSLDTCEPITKSETLLWICTHPVPDMFSSHAEDFLQVNYIIIASKTELKPIG